MGTFFIPISSVLSKSHFRNKTKKPPHVTLKIFVYLISFVYDFFKENLIRNI